MDAQFSPVAPEAVGAASRAVQDFFAAVKGLPLHSVLMMRHGRLFAEAYAHGYHADTQHRMYSISKSFVSLAVGRLILDGKLRLSDRIADFFPDRIPPSADSLVLETTIEDLLRMAPPFTDEMYDSLKADPIDTFFAMRAVYPAGTLFSYNSASPALLTAIVERVTGKAMFEFLHESVLKPIGFSSAACCIKMPGGQDWGASGVLCTPRELARVGLLLLGGGEMNGARLLPKTYVQAACSPQINTDITETGTILNGGYGYLIWCGSGAMFAFSGLGGQLLACWPALDLLLVTTADTQALRGGSEIILRAFQNTICKSIDTPPAPARETPPLHRLETPLPSVNQRALPDEILGHTVQMSENPMGLRQMRFERDGSSLLWLYENNSGRHTLRFGIGHYVEQAFPETQEYGMRLNEPIGRGYRCQAGCVFTGNDLLLARVYITDLNVGTLKIAFSFKGNRLAVRMNAYAEFFLEAYRGSCWGEWKEETHSGSEK